MTSFAHTYTTLDDGDDIIGQRDMQNVLHTIENAAYSAGEIALSTAGKIAVQDTKANAKDLVTESDVKCQQLIKDIILNDFPNDVFLGEEGIDLSGDSSSASSDALKEALGFAGESSDRLLFVVVSIHQISFFLNEGKRRQ